MPKDLSGPEALLPLPAAVEAEQVEADYDQGLLHVTLVKASGGERHGG